MADAQDAIRKRLTAHAGTTALIGTRAFFLGLPQNPTLPACVVRQVAGPRNSAMGADVNKMGATIRVGSHAATRAGAKALAEQTRTALQRYAGISAATEVHDCMMLTETVSASPETGMWSFVQEFTVWVTDLPIGRVIAHADFAGFVTFADAGTVSAYLETDPNFAGYVTPTTTGTGDTDLLLNDSGFASPARS